MKAQLIPGIEQIFLNEVGNSTVSLCIDIDFAEFMDSGFFEDHPGNPATSFSEMGIDEQLKEMPNQQITKMALAYLRTMLNQAENEKTLQSIFGKSCSDEGYDKTIHIHLLEKHIRTAQ